MKTDENGYIVVETVGVFMLFVFFVASILALVNIVALQSRVHHAITQATQTLSMYSYIYEITGTSDQFGIDNSSTSLVKADEGTLKTGMSIISSTVGALSGGSSGSANDSAGDLFSNPGELIKLFLNDARKPVFSERAIRPLIGRYLRNGTQTGDQYLKSMGVAKGINGLEIMGYDYGGGGVTSMIDRNGTITITVRYEVAYSFWGLPLPFSKLSMTQSAATRAWLGGEGVRFTG